MDNVNRRAFIEFLGTAGAAGVAALSAEAEAKGAPAKIEGLKPEKSDELKLANGLTATMLIKAGDVINAQGETFGWDNDFTAFMPLSPTEAFLWVNHESAHLLFVGGRKFEDVPSKESVDRELTAMGGSILKLRRDDAKGAWRFDKDDPHNRRISGLTPIPLVAPREIAGRRIGMGTLANCSGGITPWRTFLTCEENYDYIWGEVDPDAAERTVKPGILGYEKHYPAIPEHYGWVVEIDPFTAQARKLTALGRFAHEGSRLVVAKDGRPVVYMGDDAAGECIYKFIGDTPGSLATGTLYVADTKAGKWEALDLDKNPKLKGAFKDQTDVLVFARKAAKLAGGTPQDRPEGIDIHPKTHAVVVSTTNNVKTGNLYGSLVKIEEKGGDHTAMTFKASTFLAGGEKSGVACPDNLRFDARGNLWVCTDMSETVMHTPEYAAFANNGLFFMAGSGQDAGKPVRLASAPIDAELTGPSFSDDHATLFLSVQHPGNSTKSLDAPTSRWPDGGETLPKPAVVMIRGELLSRLTGIS